MNDLLIKNGLVFLNGKWVKTNLAVLGEKISYIGNEEVEAKEILDVEGLKVLPGLIFLLLQLLRFQYMKFSHLKQLSLS